MAGSAPGSPLRPRSLCTGFLGPSGWPRARRDPGGAVRPSRATREALKRARGAGRAGHRRPARRPERGEATQTRGAAGGADGCVGTGMGRTGQRAACARGRGTAHSVWPPRGVGAGGVRARHAEARAGAGTDALNPSRGSSVPAGTGVPSWALCPAPCPAPHPIHLFRGQRKPRPVTPDSARARLLHRRAPSTPRELIARPSPWADRGALSQGAAPTVGLGLSGGWEPGAQPDLGEGPRGEQRVPRTVPRRQAERRRGTRWLHAQAPPGAEGWDSSPGHLAATWLPPNAFGGS